MIGRDLWRQPARIAGLALEFVLTPGRIGRWLGGARALDDELVPLTPDGSEGAIRVDDVERVERRVHRLAGAGHVADRPPAQDDDEGGNRQDEGREP